MMVFVSFIFFCICKLCFGYDLDEVEEFFEDVCWVYILVLGISMFVFVDSICDIGFVMCKGGYFLLYVDVVFECFEDVFVMWE